MITEKLNFIELDVKSKIYREQNKLAAIKTIQELLSQIDFEAEVVPTKDIERLTKLLYSLKGRALNEEEIELLRSVVD